MTPSHLAFTRVTADGATPARWMLLLHGVFGTGGNLRTLARRVAEQCPRWGFVLPDLRGHGRSLGLPAPHSLATAAADLVALEAALGHPVHGLAGHSFGGKVALERLTLPAPALEVFTLLDSMPGARPERMVEDQAGRILSFLESVPWPLPSRARFLELVLAEGVGKPIAEWLAMNVRSGGREGVDLHLDLPAIRSMLGDYFSSDRWSLLDPPPAGVRTLIVVGGRSTVVREEDRARFAELADRSASMEARSMEARSMEVSVLERAGHWLHVDDLEGLVGLLVRQLDAGPV
jgi:esterase